MGEIVVFISVAITTACVIGLFLGGIQGALLCAGIVGIFIFIGA